MPKNSTSGTNIPADKFSAVVSLLNAIVTRNGHSLTWYTSRKGRVWVTLKGFQPAIYTTSAECATSSPDQETLDTFMVLMWKHIPKLQGIEPPVNTWVTRKQVEDELTEAIEWALDTYQRWQNGEMFWTGEYHDAHPPSLPGREGTGPS